MKKKKDIRQFDFKICDGMTPTEHCPLRTPLIIHNQERDVLIESAKIFVCNDPMIYSCKVNVCIHQKKAIIEISQDVMDKISYFLVDDDDSELELLRKKGISIVKGEIRGY